LIVIPAKAGTQSGKRVVRDSWVPAFAGMTIGIYGSPPMKLAFLAPLALLAAPAQAPQRIEVALSNFKFAPDTIHLEHGKSYVLHLASTGGHSFGAKAFFAAAKVDPADRKRIAGGKVELDDGESVDIRFAAPAAGTYPVRCTHLLHAGFGMTGKIVVA
jgi:uncharacterized cupredoxin-like copper-binding protein